MRYGRLLFFWFVCYASTMSFSYIAAYVWSQGQSGDWIIIAAAVSPPVFTLLFGWMYFRHLPGRMRLSLRLQASVVWVGLSVALTMAMLKFFYHEDPIAAYAGIGVAVEAMNVLAMLLAGYLAVKHTKKPAISPAAASASKPNQASSPQS